MASKTKDETKMERGFRMRVETGPAREKDLSGVKGLFAGREMKGGPRDISHTIVDGKIKRW